jgi:glycosyltransferase involved in cell wall biosynthesis
MIKVCHISTMTNFGGIEQIVRDTLLSSRDDNLKHYLICPSWNDEVIKEIQDRCIKTYLPKRSHKFDVTALLPVLNWVKKNNIDVIHSYNAFANNFGNIVSVLTGIPIICSEHGTVWSMRGVRKWLDKTAYGRAKIITANSSASAAMLNYIYKISSDKITKLLNPIPNEAIKDSRETIRKELRIPKGTVVIGTIARLVPLKGIDIFIRSAFEVIKSRENVIFVIVGGGSEYNQLKRLSKELEISSKMIFTGWRNDARRILKSFDIYVNCSIRESFGNVLIEAGFENIPVIAPNVDGIPEAVCHNKTGILINPTEPIPYRNKTGIPKYSIVNNQLSKPGTIPITKLAGEIIELYDSSEKRIAMGKEGFKKAKLFSMDNYITQLTELYQKALKL